MRSWAGAAAHAAAYCRSRGMPATAALLQQRVLPALEGVKPGAAHHHHSSANSSLFARHLAFFQQHRRMHAIGASLNLALILGGSSKEGTYLPPIARCAACRFGRWKRKKQKHERPQETRGRGFFLSKPWRRSLGGRGRAAFRIDFPCLPRNAGHSWSSRRLSWLPWPFSARRAGLLSLHSYRWQPSSASDFSSPGW